MIVQNMAIHKTIITIKDNKIFCMPKKTIDQLLLIINCNKNKLRAFLTCDLLHPLSHTRNAEKLIATYKIIQTGANTQEGGVKEGFSRILYQVLTDDLVKKLPIRPANWHIITAVISLKSLLILS